MIPNGKELMRKNISHSQQFVKYFAKRISAGIS